MPKIEGMHEGKDWVGSMGEAWAWTKDAQDEIWRFKREKGVGVMPEFTWKKERKGPYTSREKKQTNRFNIRNRK